MAQTDLPQEPGDGVDRAMLQHMLSLGGDDLRPVLIAQLCHDLQRLRAVLEGGNTAQLRRAAHELKGLSATVGAGALAELSERFDSLADGLTPAAIGAMALGLRLQIDRLIALLQTDPGPALSPASPA
jgi:HPt (histidine-containing phosphotransfer) domain-containing protein